MPDPCPGSREAEGEAVGSQAQSEAKPLLRVPSHAWPLQSPHGRVPQIPAASRRSREFQERKRGGCSRPVFTACRVRSPGARTADPPARLPRGARSPSCGELPRSCAFPRLPGYSLGPPPLPCHSPVQGRIPLCQEAGRPPSAPCPPAPPRTPPAQDPAQGRSPQSFPRRLTSSFRNLGGSVPVPKALASSSPLPALASPDQTCPCAQAARGEGSVRKSLHLSNHCSSTE